MSQNSSDNDKPADHLEERGSAGKKAHLSRVWWFIALILPAWVFTGFYSAALLTQGIFFMLHWMGASIAYVDPSVLATVSASIVYVLSIVIIMGVPWWAWRYRTTRDDLGLTELPAWGDIGLAPAGFVVYLLLSGGLVYFIGQVFPNFNASQTQTVGGFNNITQTYEYLLAFITLVLVAPLAEESLFRGYLYGKLRKTIPVWLAMVITSVLFGVIHGQWNVGVDVFALSMVACCLREVTGSIWAGILLHMMKNGLAFYILFINTSFLIK